MNKILVFLLMVIPGLVSSESISVLESDISINLDGTIDVVETITYDFQENKKRGIFREIPLEYDFEDSVRLLDIELIKVTRNNKPERQKITETNTHWKTRIGDENIYLTGEQTYSIHYKVSGAIRYFSDIDELYWNVTGSDWGVPIQSWLASVQTPQELKVVQHSCYFGIPGSNSACQNTESVGTSMLFYGNTVNPGEEATVAVGVEPGLINTIIIEKQKPHWLWLLGVLGSALLYVHTLVSFKRTHYQKKSIITQFDSYENYSVIFSGYFMDGRLESRDITAGLIELAQQGFIHIKQKGKDGLFSNYEYEIKVTKRDRDKLTPVQEQLMELFFGKSIALGTVFDTSDKKPIKATHVQKLHKNVKQYAESNKLTEQSHYPTRIVVICVAVCITSIILFSRTLSYASVPLVGFVILFISLWLALLPIAVLHRNTKKGYEMRDHLKGLYKYIDVAEKERIHFHDAPEKTPETFSKYLPFAIVFGLEKKWAQEFENITVDQEWFSTEDGHALDSVKLVSSLSQVQSQISSRTHSSHSSSSGSGGGGFSGGGSGGGGGGSW